MRNVGLIILVIWIITSLLGTKPVELEEQEVADSVIKVAETNVVDEIQEVDTNGLVWGLSDSFTEEDAATDYEIIYESLCPLVMYAYTGDTELLPELADCLSEEDKQEFNTVIDNFDTKETIGNPAYDFDVMDYSVSEQNGVKHYVALFTNSEDEYKNVSCMIIFDCDEEYHFDIQSYGLYTVEF